MAKKYNDVNYWESKPEIVKIFNDLETLHDFCRFELLPFNEADLYNNRSGVWRQFCDQNRRFYNQNRKPYQGNKPRYENRNNGERFSR